MATTARIYQPSTGENRVWIRFKVFVINPFDEQPELVVGLIFEGGSSEPSVYSSPL